MAWYSEEHLQRIEIIKKLQHERFLPLKAIKALLDGQPEVFSPEQQAFLENIRSNLDKKLNKQKTEVKWSTQKRSSTTRA